MDEKELEQVSGGHNALVEALRAKFEYFAEHFTMNNCLGCSKMSSSKCPYGSLPGRYEAFKGNDKAKCPEKESAWG